MVGGGNIFAPQMKGMKKKGLLVTGIILLASLTVRSQDSVRYLTLQEAISYSATANDEIKLSELDERIALSKFREADAVFLPQVSVFYTAATTNNPLNAFGFKLQQRSITGADFNPDLLNNPSSATDFSAKFELQQPLVNMDRLYERKAAGKQVEMYQLISLRTGEYLLFQTEKAYLQLQLLYDADKVMKEAYATSKAVLQTSKDYYEQGLIQRSDLLNAEVQVLNSETQLNSSLSNIRDASDKLSVLMGQPTGTVYTTDALSQTISLPGESPELTDDRPDLKAGRKGIEAYDLLIRSSKMKYLPKLNAFGSFQLDDSHLFAANANAWFAGFQLSWNIFNGNTTRNSIIRQGLEREKLVRRLDQQKTEARSLTINAKRQLAVAAFYIRQQHLAVEQALEALRVLQNRYGQGLAKTSDVLMAEVQLLQQKLAAVEAVFNYNLAAAYLRFLTTKQK